MAGILQSLSALINCEDAESDDDSGYLGDKVSKPPDSFGYSLAFSVFGVSPFAMSFLLQS